MHPGQGRSGSHDVGGADLGRVQVLHPDFDEFLCVETIPLIDLVDMVMSGKIRDGKTQIAILKAARIKGIY